MRIVEDGGLSQVEETRADGSSEWMHVSGIMHHHPHHKNAKKNKNKETPRKERAQRQGRQVHQSTPFHSNILF
jgi:hypothetical protein